MVHLKCSLVLVPILLLVSCGDGLETVQSAPSVPAVQVLELQKGDNICLMGNALPDRMQHHGWLETRIQSRFPDHELSFRNLGFSADELTVHQRVAGFGSWDDYLKRCQADVIFAFFGYNESFAGAEGLEKFRRDLDTYIVHTRKQKYNGESAPRLVLFSSIPFEATGDPNLPDGSEHNVRIAAYNKAMAEVALSHGVGHVDIYSPMMVRYAASKSPMTINGIHLKEQGNAHLAEVIEEGLFGNVAAVRDGARLETVRKEVIRKNLYWYNRYRATDGYNVYGGRSSLKYTDGLSNYKVLQRELQVLEAMAAKTDGLIRSLAGAGGPAEIAEAPPLIDVKTNKPGKGPDGAHLFLEGEEAISRMTPAPGMKVNLFADERRFPDLVNPVQMAWDTRGRLWVAAWRTYPHWKPDEPMDDKLLILEDTDGDGRADTCEAFADDLHNPTGFEFWNGGVLVANAPDLLFLKDTNGDGRADHRERVLHGLSSGDTHHTANSFVLGPDGAIYFQEGVFHRTQIETIHGPMRNTDACVWRFDPRSYQVDRFIPYNFANPHGHVVDAWGQHFMTDGTGNVNYYAQPFSGYVKHPQKKGGYFPFFKQRSRPCAGTEILSSPHFPAENQGNYLVANVIGFLGIFQYRFVDDGSGFGAQEVDPLVQSTDSRFRPSDIEVGPDGCVYFLDWHNPIIGHMQHHLRDPNRDQSHGRVYRVSCIDRPVVRPIPIAGESIPDLLDLLKGPGDRVRYRVRIELSGRPSPDVASAVDAWVAGLDPKHPDMEHHLLEALWVQQQHHCVDADLFRRVITSPDHRARAAATIVLRHVHGQLDDAEDLLLARANDEHPRVRLEALVAASFFEGPGAVRAALEVLRHPTDKFIDYALKETMKTLDGAWRSGIRDGTLALDDNPKGLEYLVGRAGSAEIVKLPRVPAVLNALLSRHGVAMKHRREAATILAERNNSTPVRVLLAAIRKLDRGRGAHDGHVIHELGGLLQEFIPQAKDKKVRRSLMTLASEGRTRECRRAAYAALVSHDGNVEGAWTSAMTSLHGLDSFLGAIPTLLNENTRKGLYRRIRPLMFELPEPLRASLDKDVTPGIHVAYFASTPGSAKIEAFRSMKPRSEGIAHQFDLEADAVLTREKFGLVFQGTIRIPTDGEYVFFTNSDDGSCLYIDGELVVDNDGHHAPRERKGSVRLGGGPHQIMLTYFDQGGLDSLSVSWKGPGFRKQIIPSRVLTTAGPDGVRATAVRAVAGLSGYEAEKFADAARLIGEGSLIEPAVEMLEKIPEKSWNAPRVNPVLSSIRKYVGGLPLESRTQPDVVAAIEMGKKLASCLPVEEFRSVKLELVRLGGSTVLIRTLPHEMRYDIVEFTVEAAKPVALMFRNNDVMPHNLVVTRPGTMEAIGEAAELLGLTPGGAGAQFVPKSPDVLWHTNLVNPGQSARLTFVAPETPGDYPFVCTFPGHWRVMNGVMKVVGELDIASLLPEPDAGTTADTPTRPLVKMWTFDDLAPALGASWAGRAARSMDRGRKMFTVAGCVKCHKFQGEGTDTGPPLDEIAKKYRDKELLRHIIDPSSVVLEGYENFLVRTRRGRNVVGRIVKEDKKTLCVVPNLQEPDDVRNVAVEDVAMRRKLALSPMPTGLLVTLTRAEILDLLAYIQISSAK